MKKTKSWHAARDEKFIAQDGKCAICGKTLSLDPKYRRVNFANLDHNHTSGQLRGILCGHCNRGLGLFADKPALLLKAAQYLNHWNKQPVEMAEHPYKKVGSKWGTLDGQDFGGSIRFKDYETEGSPALGIQDFDIRVAD